MPKRTPAPHAAIRTLSTVTAVAASLMLGACAGSGLSKSALTGNDDAPTAQLAAAGGDASPRTELEKAVDYWGKAYAKNPRDLSSALAYAQNLKAMGEKGQALSVLQQASMLHSNDRKLASEYGRLALEMDQIQVAQNMLQIADDPANPEWRVISARGTVLAKQGKYAEAIPFYERAKTLAQNQPSVLNNLALAYTMSGEPQKAEQLLRQANQDGADPKVRQNLALVLGLQGKYDESKQTGSPETATANTDFMRRMVKLDGKAAKDASVQVAASKPAAKAAPKCTPSTTVAAGTWEGRVAEVADAADTADTATSAGQLRPSAD